MIIDCHGHLVPPSLVDAIRRKAGEFPSIQVVEEGASIKFAFNGGNPTRPVAKPLMDMAARKSWMITRGIARQAVGPWLDMVAYEVPVAEGVRWSQLINEHFSATAVANPEFIPLASVPLQDGVAAAQVLREAHAAGLRGAMIGTQPKGIGGVLDDPALNPFWKAADDLGAIIFIHPVFECGDNRVHDYGLANAVGRITDTLIAVSRLIYAGHVTRYRNARIVIGIGGAALPFVIGRLRRNYELAKDTLADPDAALRMLYYDTLVHDHRALRFLVDAVGADRIMLGSDMPFPIGDLDPINVVTAAGFSTAEQASINGGLAQRLFGLEQSRGATS